MVDTPLNTNWKTGRLEDCLLPLSSQRLIFKYLKQIRQ